jgi:hypothetical protein
MRARWSCSQIVKHAVRDKFITPRGGHNDLEPEGDTRVHHLHRLGRERRLNEIGSQDCRVQRLRLRTSVGHGDRFTSQRD